MAFTRAQATGLLNASEMKLFDDSRANAMRGLTRTALAARITRARAARDRARDLLKRQRLAARKRGAGRGDDIAARTARKEALLVEILGRFSEARKSAPAVASPAKARKAPAKKAAVKKAAAKKSPAKKATAKKAVAKKATAKKSTAKKAATKKSVAKKGAVGKASEKKVAPKKTAAKKAPSTRTAAKSAAKKPTARKAAASKPAPEKAAAKPARTKKPRGVSAERALENTRRLLEAKQARDRTPPAWQSLEPGEGPAKRPGYQSPEAADKAHDLHAGEARMASIHGRMASHDRHDQGRRDHRGEGGDRGNGS